MTGFCLGRALARMAVFCFLVVAVAPRCNAQTRGAGNAETGQHRPLNVGNQGLVDRPYRIGPGDVLDVAYRYTPEFNDEVTVGPDGRVDLKAAGVVRAAGATVEELEQTIASAASVKLVKPEVAITLKDFDRPHVFVAGEVNAPGRQELRHPTTVLQALLMCGGPKDDAALSRVLLFRRIDGETAEVHVLRLSHYSRRARADNDMLLQPDDMILVRHDLPSRVERVVKMANLGFYLNPLQNVSMF